MDSLLAEHGLDKYDIVEIAMQVEEDLGYFIPAENLAVFQKPKHFVNYIQHIEKFKREKQRNPEA